MSVGQQCMFKHDIEYRTPPPKHLLVHFQKVNRSEGNQQLPNECWISIYKLCSK